MNIKKIIFEKVIVFGMGSKSDCRGTVSILKTDDIPGGFICREQRVYTIPKAGTFYGIHYSSEEYPQAKLITVIHGAGKDYIVDLRKDSSTYLQWKCIELNGRDSLCLYIPAGFGHGFLSEIKDTVQLFSADAEFVPGSTMRINCRDKMIGLDLPENIILSEPDRNAPYLV